MLRTEMATPGPAMTETLALPDKPSIAVLPFANMSCDAEQVSFSDGIADDIIADLSREHSLFVISRSSSFMYKGSLVDRNAPDANLACVTCWKAAHGGMRQGSA